MLKTKSAYQLLDSSKAGLCTWTSGGCGILALAVEKAFGFPVYALIGRGQVDHMVNKLPNGNYLDADGESKDIIASFSELENIEYPLTLQPYNGNHGEITIDDEAVDKLATFLKDNL